jgi:hypothetical protein
MKGLSSDWIGSLYPSVECILKAHRAFVLQLLKAPARELGAARWGFKEVRLTIEHAIYLKWLFAKAKLLFLYRNPYDAYLSYRSMKQIWHRRFPDDAMSSAREFGNHWRSLLEGYIEGHQEVNGLLICYEALCTDESVRKQVSAYLGFSDSPSEPLEDLRGVEGPRPDKDFLRNEVSRVELWSLRRQVEPLASRLGYDGPSVLKSRRTQRH